ncbi:hypothetical protein B296_00048291 [Ensete ventricosum]|uniref:Uncharacterized protein n=1 Tax=Ensete ventricosum TaxID=4639 RepID=A0A426X478_ENSVE|nr:hypothetical protein B296_00048291 [Ensete ventricosum]
MRRRPQRTTSESSPPRSRRWVGGNDILMPAVGIGDRGDDTLPRSLLRCDLLGTKNTRAMMKMIHGPEEEEESYHYEIQGRQREVTCYAMHRGQRC